jgi:hypothetical protein
MKTGSPRRLREYDFFGQRRDTAHSHADLDEFRRGQAERFAFFSLKYVLNHHSRLPS